MRCGYLPEVYGGLAYVSGRNAGDTVKFECFDGFKLIGEDTLTCGSNGQWSGTSPICDSEYFNFLYIF